MIYMNIQMYSDQYRNQVIQLWKSCDLVKPWHEPGKDIDRKLKVDPDLFLIGLEDDAVIGTVMGGYEGHRGWVNYLAVAAEKRFLGYGRDLMLQVESRIKAKGCPKINLQIRESNIEVQKFYLALGYGNDHVIGLGKRLESDR
jgi:ribosomal protein S18 acetylase RimI-like enzyme